MTKRYARRGEALTYFENVVMRHDGDECLFWPHAQNGCGYGQVYIDGCVYYVHREVCRRVHGDPPSPAHEASHSCGNGHIGCVAKKHLSWKTRADNQADRVVHGTSNRGERCASSKLTPDDVRTIRREADTTTRAELARRFGVNESSVRLIISGKNWGWLDGYASASPPKTKTNPSTGEKGEGE